MYVSMYVCVTIRPNHLLLLRVSKPNSKWYSFSWEVPLIAPNIKLI